MKAVFQKSVVTTVDIAEGEPITRQMLAIKKPGTGIPPKRLDEVVGSRALRNIPANSVLQESDVAITQSAKG